MGFRSVAWEEDWTTGLQIDKYVRGLPHRPGDRAHALALHHARQIVSFYVHYSQPQPPASDSLVYRDAHAAQNLR